MALRPREFPQSLLDFLRLGLEPNAPGSLLRVSLR